MKALTNILAYVVLERIPVSIYKILEFEFGDRLFILMQYMRAKADAL